MDALGLFTQQSYFDFHPIDTSSDEMDEAFRLRYQVYCIERSFLDAEMYPTGSEVDDYDPYSQHFSAYDRSHRVAGSVRLVSHSPDFGYPYQSHCPVFQDVLLPPNEEAREISRLVVSKAYRRRQEDSQLGINESGAEPPAEFANKRGGHPIIVLGLFRVMYHYSLDCGVRYWYAAMERSLARLLVRYGFDFTSVGPQVDYYGPVSLYLGDLRRLEANLSVAQPDLYKWFCGRGP